MKSVDKIRQIESSMCKENKVQLVKTLLATVRRNKITGFGRKDQQYEDYLVGISNSLLGSDQQYLTLLTVQYSNLKNVDSWYRSWYCNSVMSRSYLLVIV